MCLLLLWHTTGVVSALIEVCKKIIYIYLQIVIKAVKKGKLIKRDSAIFNRLVRKAFSKKVMIFFWGGGPDQYPHGAPLGPRAVEAWAQPTGGLLCPLPR